MAPAPIAHPQRPSAAPQTLMSAHGHHDQRSRRARVQKLRTPFGARDRGSMERRRPPCVTVRVDQDRGRLLARGNDRDVRDQQREALETIRQERERLRDSAETARAANEQNRGAAEAARDAMVDGMRATADTLNATLEQMKV